MDYVLAPAYRQLAAVSDATVHFAGGERTTETIRLCPQALDSWRSQAPMLWGWQTIPQVLTVDEGSVQAEASVALVDGVWSVDWTLTVDVAVDVDVWVWVLAGGVCPRYMVGGAA